MIYMSFERARYFFVIMIAVHHKSFCLTELHIFSRKDGDLNISKYVILFIQGSPWELLWGSPVTLKIFVLIQSCYMPSYMVLGSRMPELNDKRMVCLLKTVIPGWVTNTVSFTLVFDYIRHCGSWKVLQAKIKCLVSEVSRVPQTNNTSCVMDRILYISCMLLRVGRWT